MTEQTIGARVRAAREAAGLTLEELATRVGSTKSYIWELESKVGARPSADLVHRLAQELGMTVEQLITGKSHKEEAATVFFREYEKLSDPDKKKLIEIAKILNTKGT